MRHTLGPTGFTLLEFLLVISLSTALLALIIPAYRAVSSNHAAYNAAVIFASHVHQQLATASVLEQNAAIRITSQTSYYLFNYSDTSQIAQDLRQMGVQVLLQPSQPLPYVYSFTPGGAMADPSSPADPSAVVTPTTLPIPQFTAGTVTYQVLILRDPNNPTLPGRTVTVRKI